MISLLTEKYFKFVVFQAKIVENTTQFQVPVSQITWFAAPLCQIE